MGGEPKPVLRFGFDNGPGSGRCRGNRHGGRLLEGPLDRGGRGGEGARNGEDGNLALEVGNALGEGLEGEIGLRTGDAREGDLQNEALVGGRAHLAGGLPEDGERACDAVGRAKGRRLRPQLVELLPLRDHDVIRTRDGSHHVDVTQMRRQLACKAQQVATSIGELRDLAEERRHIPVRHCTRHLAQHGAGDLAEQVLRRLEADMPSAKD